MYKSLYLKKGKEESLKRFHPWIFSGAVSRVDENIDEGEIVRVFTSNGDFIAVGMFQIGSIAVRVLSFRDILIDAKFWEARLSSAWEMRTLRLACTAAVNTALRKFSLVTICEQLNVNSIPPGLMRCNPFTLRRVYPFNALRKAPRCLAKAGGSRTIRSYILSLASRYLNASSQKAA